MRGENFPVNNKPYAIIERGGVKVGLIGLMSQELYGLVNQNNLVGIKVLSPVETARKYIKELRPKVDLLVAITHQGVDEDSALAEEVSGLDIIIGGHSHTRLKSPRVVNHIPIVQTGSNCENLGVLDVTLEHGRVVAVNWKPDPTLAGPEQACEQSVVARGFDADSHRQGIQ